MTASKKYGIMLVSLIISISLVFPFCCHAEQSGQAVPQQASYHGQASHPHQHDAMHCECDHQLQKNNAKASKVPALSPQKILPAVFAVTISSLLYIREQHQSISHRELNTTTIGPPLHLLNNVFLN